MLLSINICTTKKYTELETLIYETVSQHYSERNHEQIREINKRVLLPSHGQDITLRKIITAKTLNSLL